MTALSLMQDTVVVLRAAVSTDRYGNTVAGAVTETTITGCAVVPPGARLSTTGGSEIIYGRDTVESRMVLMAPLDADVRATDRVRHDGLVYEVDGQPERFNMTNLRHIAARLKAVTG